MEKEYTWERRTEEWIKANPGQGTMYKKYKDTEHELPALTFKTEENSRRWDYDEHKGIYVIICEIEKYAYVGQSRNMNSRLRNHKMIMVHTKPHETKTYIKMREHVAKHGIEAFQFLKHLPMPDANMIELTNMENEVMGNFVRKGYNLYNSAISLQMRDECVICPKEFQPVILQSIELLASKTDFVNKLTGLVNGENILKG